MGPSIRSCIRVRRRTHPAKADFSVRAVPLLLDAAPKVDFISGGKAPIILHIHRARSASRIIGAMAPKIAETVKRGRGRPAVFDRAAALKEAMKLFWERGYEGTSFDELIGAMGISASSFYNSFGNKEELYREATEAYVQSSGGWFLGILHDETIDTRTA